QNYVGADRDMTCQSGVVAENTTITHYAVMGHMTIGHDETVIAYHGFHAVRSALVDSGTLPDRGVVTNMYRGLLSLIFEVLRHGRDYSTWKNVAVFANPCAFHDGYVGTDPSPLSNGHIIMYSGKGLNDHVFGNLGPWVNV